MNKLQTTAAVAAMMLGFGMTANAADTSEEMRDVDAFKSIKLMGSMDVEVTVGERQSVKVIADSDIIDHLETSVSGDTLRVKLENGHYGHIKVMRVIVTMPEMTGASIQGSGDMIVTGAAADDFELELQGSGDATFKKAKFGKIDIELQGSGDIELDGSCDDIKIELQGSGDVDAGDLKCKTADVDLRGSGDIEFFASESAGVGVHGSGDVVVKGSPDKINSRVRGSGDIIMR
ncbi:head GIN domain-containing protein [Kordiimonas gwangyangensis]|uniref:head GIN domain-containing protein n=1 Tax=Kordiimonas gwangyangensis TaxID=288022 RepID=UPI00037AB6C2|nr:head GIN domain-containing protein [Kordiimonas gwangyangensis]